jgi:hypothetical protein
MKIGLGGFVGKREVGAGVPGTLIADQDYDSSCIALDLTLPIAKGLSVIGEAWTGTALDGYRGGVWQSYVVTDARVETIDAWGAFLNVVWKPYQKWRFVVGSGIDDPENADFHGGNSSSRLKNTTIFGNALYSFYPGATVGVEYDHMETEYLQGGATNDRFQISFMYKF